MHRASSRIPAQSRYYYLGKLYERVEAQSQKQIMKKLRGYLALNPNDPWAHYFYGSGLFQEQRALETSDFSEAEGYFRKAIKLKHDLAHAYFGLGLLYYEKGKVAESILEFQRAAQTDPTMHEAHYRLGIAYSKLGEKEKSQSEFDLQRKLRSQSTEELDKRRRELFDVVPRMKSFVPEGISN